MVSTCEKVKIALKFGNKKLKRLKKVLKGWNLNVEGEHKKIKKYLSKIIKDIDIKSESFGVSASDRQTRLDCEIKLEQIDRETEIKIKQRMREKYFRRG
jgi:hypothetical protein